MMLSGAALLAFTHSPSLSFSRLAELRMMLSGAALFAVSHNLSRLYTAEWCYPELLYLWQNHRKQKCRLFFLHFLTHFLMGSEQKLILMFSECPSTLTEQFQLLFSRGKSELVGQAQVQVDLILKVLNLIYFTFEAGFFIFKTVFSCWS